MKRLLRENGLSIVSFALFALFLVGQSVSGWLTYSEDEQQHGNQPVAYTEYLVSGRFGESVFENWESEFLQMGMFVLLTVKLRQKGSPESKKMNEPETVDREPGTAAGTADLRRAPWPVRAGGLALTLYSHSLSAALLALFVLSFVLHAWSGAVAYSQEELQHGGEAVSMLGYVASARFWFESFQNWQSEFLAIGALVVLAVFLREKGSPESKPVDAPHYETGTDEGPKPGEAKPGESKSGEARPDLRGLPLAPVR